MPQVNSCATLRNEMSKAYIVSGLRNLVRNHFNMSHGAAQCTVNISKCQPCAKLAPPDGLAIKIMQGVGNQYLGSSGRVTGPLIDRMRD